MENILLKIEKDLRSEHKAEHEHSSERSTFQKQAILLMLEAGMVFFFYFIFVFEFLSGFSQLLTDWISGH